MARDAVSQLLSYAGWAFLPRFAASFLQNLYYRISIRAGSPHPQPSSPQYARHYRRIYIFVVTSYLLYTLYEAFYRICLDGDFYQALGVLPSSDDQTIKSRFRRLAVLHHPDKSQHSPNEENSDAMFVYLKLAQDTLLNPTKRFAYDRFGIDVVEGSKAKSIRDFFYAGLYNLLPQYAGGFAIMVVLNMFWFSSWARYWRFFTFFALFTLELSLLTHRNGIFMPSAYLPTWISSLLRLDSFYLLPFQILTLARTASVTTNIFISQLTPPGESSKDQSAGEGMPLKPQTQQKLMQLAQLSRTHDMKISKLLQLELAPFKGDVQSVERLRKRMKDKLIFGPVKEDPEVKAAVRNVMEQKGSR